MLIGLLNLICSQPHFLGVRFISLRWEICSYRAVGSNSRNNVVRRQATERINKLRKNEEDDSDLSFGAVVTVASK